MLTWTALGLSYLIFFGVRTTEQGRSDNKYQRPSSITLWKYGSTVSAIQWRRYIFGLSRSKIWSISGFGWENNEEICYPKCLSPTKIQHKTWSTMHSQAPLTSCVSLHELGKRQYKKIKCMLPFISKAGANSHQVADAGTDKGADQSRLAHGAKDQRAKGTKSTQWYYIAVTCLIGWAFLRDTALSFLGDWEAALAPCREENEWSQLFGRFCPRLAWHGPTRQGRGSLISGYFSLRLLVLYL